MYKKGGGKIREIVPVSLREHIAHIQATRPRIIAVDFDGTLCVDNYPNIGDPIPSVIEYVKRLKAAGNIVVLWTCRVGQYLSDAVTWCKHQGLIFDYINENVKENIEKYGGNPRKVYADVYIDDKTLLPQQIIIKELSTMTNKEQQEITTKIATAVITEIDDAVANYIADNRTGNNNDGLDALTYALGAVASKYGVTYRHSLDAYSWSEIAEIAKSGRAAAHFHIGDEKQIELITGEIVTAVILGFDHDVLDSDIDKTAGVTFGIKGVLDGWFEMNADDTNVGGWRKSKMRTAYMQRIERLLPDDVRDALQPVVKITAKGGGSGEVESTVDKLFLLSGVEVFGDDASYTDDPEGEQYEYYKKPENRVKRRVGSACTWWLRSPYTTNAATFCRVSATGTFYVSLASYAYGVSFGFCF